MKKKKKKKKIKKLSLRIGESNPGHLGASQMKARDPNRWTNSDVIEMFL